MTLIVEDGTGLSNADAYVDEAYVTAYNTAYIGSDAWTTSIIKKRAIRQATQYLDRTYKRRWKGVKLTDTQSLDFARIGIYDTDGYLLDASPLPEELQQATAELSIRVSAGVALTPDQSTSGAGITAIRNKLDTLEQEIQYSGGGVIQSPTFPTVDSLLTDLIQSGNTVCRV